MMQRRAKKRCSDKTNNRSKKSMPIFRKRSKRSHHRKRSMSIQPRHSASKFVRWRPGLNVIFKDKLLLDALIKHCTRTYNEENILFLQSIEELKNGLYDIVNVDSKILSIYDLYINRTAEHQINLSSSCFTDIVSKRDEFKTFDDDQKLSMFDFCVNEIKQLTVTSVLPSFYVSKAYQTIASQSKYYVANKVEPVRIRRTSHSTVRPFASRMHSNHSMDDDCPIPMVPLSITSSYTSEPDVCCVVPSDPSPQNKKRRRSTIKLYKLRMPASNYKASASFSHTIPMSHSPFGVLAPSPLSSLSPLSPSSSFSLLSNSETDFGCIP